MPIYKYFKNTIFWCHEYYVFTYLNMLTVLRTEDEQFEVIEAFNFYFHI